MCSNVHDNFTNFEASEFIRNTKNLKIFRIKYFFFKQKDSLSCIQAYNMAKDSSLVEVTLDARWKYSV